MPADFRACRACRALLTILAFLLAVGTALAQEAPAGPPYRVGGEVTRPEKVSGDPPAYTELARRARITGVVIVEAIIDEQGNVSSTRVLKGLPMGLDRAAVDAVEAWKFKPATMYGKPVAVYYTLTVSFQMDADLSFGPRFGELLQMNPELAELARAQRYEDAAALLDRWIAERPKEPDLHLGRTFVLLAQGRYDAAWEEAQAYDGPDSFELFYFFGVNAQNQAFNAQDSTARYELVEVGLQAIEKAVGERPDDINAISMKSRLLQHKAMLMSDDDEDAQAVRIEADRLERQAAELRASKGGLTFPEKLSGDPAELTEMARKAGISGTVTVEAVIDEQGNVADARVVKGLPMGLDEKALEAVRTWKFKPATVGGKPMKVNYTVTVTFR
jgi:TonB family protein